jgi:hypothetical protein
MARIFAFDILNRSSGQGEVEVEVSDGIIARCGWLVFVPIMRDLRRSI